MHIFNLTVQTILYTCNIYDIDRELCIGAKLYDFIYHITYVPIVPRDWQEISSCFVDISRKIISDNYFKNDFVFVTLKGR